MNVVLILVYSIVLLVFMIYPAMKVTELVERRVKISDKFYNFITVFLTILFSLILGIGLYYL